MEPEFKSVLFGGALIVLGYVAGTLGNGALQIAVTGMGTALAAAGLTLKAMRKE